MAVDVKFPQVIQATKNPVKGKTTAPKLAAVLVRLISLKKRYIKSPVKSSGKTTAAAQAKLKGKMRNNKFTIASGAD